ncbi:MAG: replicative DNA helicase [Parcubacteria group bacterium Gr01-1014_38]|nr:MAG: replicative DNA helicase [Parcubacteria group bacterium Gr01-1014_38]
MPVKSGVSGDHLPPHNLEAEASVLGALLLDHEAVVKIADFLRPQDFYSPSHATIYAAMVELFERRDPIDVLSVTNRLAEKKELEIVGGEAALASLAASVPTAGHVVHYARIVQKKATLRRLISAAADIHDLGFTEEEEVDRVLDDAEQKLFAVSQQHLRQTFVPVREVLADAFQRIDALHKGGAAYRGIPSGLKPLDDILSGLQKSDLVILAARPSVGKTSLALDIGRHIAVREKVPVGIFSLEMSKEQLADRLICAEAAVDLWKMRTGRLSSEGFPHDDFSKINHAMAILAEAPIYIDDSATSNVLEIRTLARRLQAEHGIGFLVLDYLQLMEGPRAREGRVQEVSEISRALKGLARELNIPVLAVSQLSRAVEGRSPPVPKLSDLRESGSIEQDADVVLFLYPSGRHEKTVEHPNIVDVIIAKHRNGPIGTVSLFFRSESASFSVLDVRHAETPATAPAAAVVSR